MGAEPLALPVQPDGLRQAAARVAGGESGDIFALLSPSPSRVLVVDDEAHMRAILRRVLDPAGYEILEAPDGETALELFRRERPDLILSDLVMPGMSGTDLLRQVRALDREVAYILLTGAGGVQDAVDALRLQADDYLVKPFHVDEVQLAVGRALRHRELVRQNRMYREHLEDRVGEQTRQLERMFVDALRALANAVETRDGYTGGHIERVTRYAVATGRALGMKGDALRNLRVAALLHDVGKIGIPDHILTKPGKLTTEEYEIMKRHPVIGARILERSPFLSAAIPGVLSHHERWDGLGYPDGLEGAEIPIEGRILAVADTYDAIVTTRVYREMRPVEAAIGELRRCAGTQFDPDVVEAFVALLKEGLPETSVFVSD